MRFSRMFSAVDTHTQGQPTRTVIAGLPPIPGKTVADKMIYLRDRMDWVRTLLVYEPRGSSIMSGVIVTPPHHPEADIGLIFIEVGGYLPMCGHSTIGAVTALIETGIIEPSEPETLVVLDTPAGVVRVTAEVDGGRITAVRFTNVAAFLQERDVVVDVPGLGTVTCDIAYGGNYYAILSAEDVGVDLDPTAAASLIAAATRIRGAINSSIDIHHPEKPFISGVTHVQFSGPARDPSAHARNCVVFQPGGIDRSPCGTGTTARVAALFFRGGLEIGQEFVHESITGTLFSARPVEETSVGRLPAVTVEIAGRAFVTGLHSFVLDPDDPLPGGFLLDG